MKVLKGDEKKIYDEFMNTIEFEDIPIDENLKAPEGFETIKPRFDLEKPKKD